MTQPTPDTLEQQLRELTRFDGQDTTLWQNALDAAAGDQARPSWKSRAGRIATSNRALIGMAACFVVIFAVIQLAPPSRGLRGASASVDAERSARSALPSLGQAVESWKDVDRAKTAEQGWRAGDLGGARKYGYAAADAKPSREDSDAGVRVQTGIEVASTTAQPRSGESRHVIQKATIDLQTPDVRAAFAKATHLVSAAGGEFVETSSLTGDGKTAQANLTLRVGIARLSDVMNSLRTLGDVKSENTTGEDVTSQVVDLEARLRNEQRIEQELLQLLDSRADAPLKDILELRNSLSTVRQSIEQYIAQRDRLGHLVSLASILVVIRAEPEAAPEPKPAASIFTYFKHTIAEAWHNGLRAASDSMSWLVSFLVSGVLWWLLVAALLAAVLRYRRRLAARCV